MSLFHSDPLPRAAFLAYKARKGVVAHSDVNRGRLSLQQCNRAGRLLRDSMKLIYPEQGRSAIKVSNDAADKKNNCFVKNTVSHVSLKKVQQLLL